MQKNNTKVQVAKNTLVTKAVKCWIRWYWFKWNKYFLWSEDQISACKVADNLQLQTKINFY